MISPMRIVVLDGYTINPGDNPWTDLEALGDVKIHDRTPDEEVLSRSQGAQVLVVNKVKLTNEVIAELPDLKFIAETATGYDNIDIVAANTRGIPVSNIPVYGTDTVAQFVFAHILNHCHRIELHAQAVAAGEWSQCGDFAFWKTPLIELAEKSLGIVGFGRIGRRVGEIAHAFGMDVLAYDIYHGDEPRDQPFRWVEVEDLFAGSDFITLHCNLTRENTGMVNRAMLANTKPGAFLINAARGPLVNDLDLADALNTGKLSGAALDVISTEPISDGNPLLKAKNCTITPHIAWATLEARRRMVVTTVQNIANFTAGTPSNLVT